MFILAGDIDKAEAERSGKADMLIKSNKINSNLVLKFERSVFIVHPKLFIKIHIFDNLNKI